MNFNPQDLDRCPDFLLVGQRSIAAFLGVSPRTVIRHCKDWEKRGLVALLRVVQRRPATWCGWISNLRRLRESGEVKTGLARKKKSPLG